MRLLDKRKAIEMRRQGKSYNEIISQIPDLSKGTLSGWLSYLELTRAQQQRLTKRQIYNGEKARLRAAETNRAKRIKRMNDTIQRAEKETEFLMNNPLFLLG